MDQDNLADLQARAEPEYHERIRLFLDYADNAPGRDVPDPYYGGATGFEKVLDLIEEAAAGLLDDVQQSVSRQTQNG